MRTDSNHTVLIGGSRGYLLSLLPANPSLCSFPRWAVLHDCKLHKSLPAKVRDSPTCSSLFVVRYSLQNMYFKLSSEHTNPEYVTRDCF